MFYIFTELSNQQYNFTSVIKLACSPVISLHWFWLVQPIFFTVASTLLCSGFMMKTVLVTHQCFSSCWAVLTWSQSLFLLLMLPCQQGGWECTRWEGTQAGQLISTDWRIRPYDIMISNKRSGGKFAGAAIAQGLAGHQSDGGEKFCFSSVSSLPHLHQPTIY